MASVGWCVVAAQGAQGSCRCDQAQRQPSAGAHRLVASGWRHGEPPHQGPRTHAGQYGGLDAQARCGRYVSALQQCSGIHAVAYMQWHKCSGNGRVAVGGGGSSDAIQVEVWHGRMQAIIQARYVATRACYAARASPLTHITAVTTTSPPNPVVNTAIVKGEPGRNHRSHLRRRPRMVSSAPRFFFSPSVTRSTWAQGRLVLRGCI